MDTFNFKPKISLEVVIKHFVRFIKNTNKSTVGKKKLFSEQPNSFSVKGMHNQLQNDSDLNLITYGCSVNLLNLLA